MQIKTPTDVNVQGHQGPGCHSCSGHKKPRTRICIYFSYMYYSKLGGPWRLIAYAGALNLIDKGGVSKGRESVLLEEGVFLPERT